MTVPGSHLMQVDCVGCGEYTLAVAHMADRAQCSTCLWATAEKKAAQTPFRIPEPVRPDGIPD